MGTYLVRRVYKGTKTPQVKIVNGYRNATRLFYEIERAEICRTLALIEVEFNDLGVENGRKVLLNTGLAVEEVQALQEVSL